MERVHEAWELPDDPPVLWMAGRVFLVGACRVCYGDLVASGDCEFAVVDCLLCGWTWWLAPDTARRLGFKAP